MPIIGIESTVHGVDDIELCSKFLQDFGLPLSEQGPQQQIFSLEAGCRVILRQRSDPELPKPWYEGQGVREIVLGVDTAESVEALVAKLSTDRQVQRGADGCAHFYADDGTAFGLRVYAKKPVITAPDPVNSPGNVNRLNQQRKWFARARPRTINHLVLMVTDYAASARFLMDRLGFRLSDHQLGFAVFMRADGTNEHHTIAFTQGPAAKYHHTAYAVEDIDEVMVGANHMHRCGWTTKGVHVEAGLGRHRISSSLFYYLMSPGGGEIEYSADTDYLNDHWIPRVWKGLYGYSAWTHNMPAPLQKEEAWDPRFWKVEFDPTAASLRVDHGKTAGIG